MKPENAKKLHDAFPLLYAPKRRFECGDGWFQLIWDLSEKLEPIIAKFHKENPEIGHPLAMVVKQRLGMLYYKMSGLVSGTTMSRDILEACDKSQYVCELCGAAGEIRGGKEIKTLCAPCAQTFYGP